MNFLSSFFIGILTSLLITEGLTSELSSEEQHSRKPNKTEQEIIEDIERLRELFIKKEIDAFIVPHNDEYQSEDLPERNKRLQWLTGFTGSAGVAVITCDKAVLFVDGRYTKHARDQAPSIITVEEDNGSGWKTWLKNNMRNKKVGYDSKLYLNKDYDAAELNIIQLIETENLVDNLWANRPGSGLESIIIYPEQFAGESAQSKIQKIRKKISEGNFDATIILDLDSIAWLLNIRGKDLPYTPVVLSWLILPKEGHIHLIAPGKVLNEQNEV